MDNAKYLYNNTNEEFNFLSDILLPYDKLFTEPTTDTIFLNHYQLFDENIKIKNYLGKRLYYKDSKKCLIHEVKFNNTYDVNKAIISSYIGHIDDIISYFSMDLSNFILYRDKDNYILKSKCNSFKAILRSFDLTNDISNFLIYPNTNNINEYIVNDDLTIKLGNFNYSDIQTNKSSLLYKDDKYILIETKNFSVRAIFEKYNTDNLPITDIIEELKRFKDTIYLIPKPKLWEELNNLIRELGTYPKNIFIYL